MAIPVDSKAVDRAPARASKNERLANVDRVDHEADTYHDDGTSKNEVVNSTRDPIDDSAPGATFMLVGMSYPVIAAVLAVIAALVIWATR